MPKVSRSHLENRRRQIVDAAIRLFAENGFQATSMQQIVKASGMSAGAVYHYFPAKRGLIAAVGQRLRDAYAAPLGQYLDVDPLPPPRVILTSLAASLADIHCDGLDFTRLGIFVWGEALRDPELGAEVARIQLGLRDLLVDLARRWQEQGVLSRNAGPEQIAVALYALMSGFTLQLNLLGDVDAESLVEGALALGANP